MPALVHWHVLKCLKRQILINRVGGEQLLNDYYLVSNLGEAVQEIAMGCSGVHFITKLVQGCSGGLQQLRGGEGQ